MNDSQGHAAWVRPAWWVVAWFGVGLLLWLSLMRDPPQMDFEESDKLQHIAAYTMLTAWWMQMWQARGRRIALVIGLMGLGVAIEFAQAATGYRSYSYGDMAADATGIALGWLAAPPRLPDFIALLQHLFGRDASAG